MLQHQQQVAVAVERAKQITITELNAVMQVIMADILGMMKCLPIVLWAIQLERCCFCGLSS